VAGAAPVPLAAVADEDFHPQHLFQSQFKVVTPGGFWPARHLFSLPKDIFSLADLLPSGNNVPQLIQGIPL
jgi:hypothetical protein